jgi:hypothetical protein
MDITPEEKLLMQEHARYTRQSFDAGKILIYGPVMAPDGAFGMAVFDSTPIICSRSAWVSFSVQRRLRPFRIDGGRCGKGVPSSGEKIDA